MRVSVADEEGRIANLQIDYNEKLSSLKEKAARNVGMLTFVGLFRLILNAAVDVMDNQRKTQLGTLSYL